MVYSGSMGFLKGCDFFLFFLFFFSIHGSEEDNGLPPVLKSQFISHGLPMLLFLDQAGLEELRISKETHQAQAKGNGSECSGPVKATSGGKAPFEESGDREALKIQDEKSGLGLRK